MDTVGRGIWPQIYTDSRAMRKVQSPKSKDQEPGVRSQNGKSEKAKTNLPQRHGAEAETGTGGLATDSGEGGKLL